MLRGVYSFIQRVFVGDIRYLGGMFVFTTILWLEGMGRRRGDDDEYNVSSSTFNFFH